MTVEAICDQCGMSYDWPGVTVGGLVYCCAACSQGLPCTCAGLGRHKTVPDDVVVVDSGTTVVDI